MTNRVSFQMHQSSLGSTHYLVDGMYAMLSEVVINRDNEILCGGNVDKQRK